MRSPVSSRLPFVSALLPLAVVAALCVPVVISLLSVVDHVSDTPFVVQDATYFPFLVELEPVERDGDRQVRRMRLQQQDPGMLLRHQEVRIAMATYRTRPELLSARLDISGSTCSYRAPIGETLRNSTFLRLVLSGPCNPHAGGANGSYELVVEYRGGRVAVWTTLSSTGAMAENAIQLVQTWPSQPWPPALSGRYIGYLGDTTVRRIDLLAYLWQIGRGPSWIWFALSLAVLLAVTGAVSFPMIQISPAPASPTTWRASAGAAAFAAAVGLAYAVLVPPFQAADEPDHLLSYGRLTDDESIRIDAAEWAKLGHLDRIAFHGDEKFRPLHIGRAFPSPWGSTVTGSDVSRRSGTTFWLWRLLDTPLQDLDLPRLLFSIRLVNVIVFAIAVGLATAALIRMAEAPYRHLAPLIILLVPAIPFFAMYVSMTALLVSSTVLLTGALVTLFLDGPRTHAAGLLFGGAAGLVFVGGRNGLITAPLVVAALLLRALLGTRGTTTRGAGLRQAGLFWGGFAAGATLFLALVTEPYLQEITRNVTRYVPDALRRAAVMLPGIRMSMLLALSAAGFALELLVSVVRRRRKNGHVPGTLGRITGVTAYLAAAVVVAILVGSLFIEYPTLGIAEAFSRPSASQYASEVLRVLVTSLRLGEPDLMLSASFWAGFGWIDTLPNLAFVGALEGATGIALTLLLVRLAYTRDYRRTVWLGLFMIAVLISVAITAASVYGMKETLHGRFLIAIYLPVLGVIWSVMAMAPPWPAIRQMPLTRVPIFLTLCAVGHVYCLNVILARYF